MTPAPRVLVTDAGRGSAISIIRSLGRRGMHVVAADADPRSPGFRSRYAAEPLLYPPPSEAPERVVAALLQAVQQRGIDLVIPVSDDVILPLSEARERFAGLTRLAIAESPALAVTTNKLATLELADRLGVPRPKTVLVGTVEEAREGARELGWPLVLKPQASRVYEPGGVASFEVGYASGLDDLTARMEVLEGRCQVLLQQHCPGEGHGVELLMHEGRPLAAFQHKRVHEVPFTGGASSFRESVPLDLTLLALSERLLGEIAWTGLAMVEFKIGRDRPRLMEVNGRVWGSLPLAVKSGMDFPARLAELYLSGPPDGGAFDATYSIGVRARNLELEVIWIGSVLSGRRRYPFLPAPRRREALGAALALLDPRVKYDILSLDDPGPGLAELAKIARKLPRKLRRAR